MQLITSKKEIEYLIGNHNMVLLYFSGSNCGVCKIIKPQIVELIKKYPNIYLFEIETEKHADISAQYDIFTLPSLILFIDGKETIRKLRYMSIVELESIITRYYDLYYKN